jgi:hypothetical protein
VLKTRKATTSAISSGSEIWRKAYFEFTLEWCAAESGPLTNLDRDHRHVRISQTNAARPHPRRAVTRRHGLGQRDGHAAADDEFRIAYHSQYGSDLLRKRGILTNLMSPVPKATIAGGEVY